MISSHMSGKERKSKARLVLPVIIVLSLCFAFVINGDSSDALSDTMMPVEQVDENYVTMNGMVGIKTPAQFMEIGKHTLGDGTPYEDYTIGADYVLLEDISLMGLTVSPIGSAASPFTGSFDGNGYVITGMEVTVTGSASYAGMFAATSSTAVLKNIASENASITANGRSSYVGGIVGLSDGKIINSYSSGTVTLTTSDSSAGSRSTISYTGGIAGRSNGEITNCYSEGTVDASVTVQNGTTPQVYSYIGGITGRSSGTITECYNESAVTNVLSWSNVASATYCHNYVSGIVGLWSGTVTKCYNVGDVKNTVTVSNVTTDHLMNYIAGIAGLADSVLITTVSKCYNEGDILNSVSAASVNIDSLGSRIGGIVGLLRVTGSMTQDCYNRGSVVDDNSGIVSGTINAIGNRLGGVLGFLDTPGAVVSVKNCYSTGQVVLIPYTGATVTTYNDRDGGAVGYFSSLAKISDVYYHEDAVTVHDITQKRTGAELKSISATTFSSWDFSNTWTFAGSDVLNDGYPILKNVGPLTAQFTSQPQNQNKVDAPAGDITTFSVSVASHHDVVYQWQYFDGSAWVDMAGETSDTLSFLTSSMSSGTQFRCVVSKVVGLQEIELGVSNAATFTKSSASVVTKEFTIKVSGDDGVDLNPVSNVKVKHWQDLTVMFAAKPGYKITEIIIDHESHPELITAGSYTFKKVNMTHSIVVRTAISDTASLTINIIGNGSVEYSIDGGDFVKYQGTTKVSKGSKIILREIVGDNKFQGWSGAISSKSGTISLSDVDSDILLNALFDNDNDDSIPLYLVFVVILLILVLIIVIFLMRKKKKN